MTQESGSGFCFYGVRRLDAALVSGGLTPLYSQRIESDSCLMSRKVLSTVGKGRQAAPDQSGVKPPHSKGLT
jgi:hypothetical protein